MARSKVNKLTSGAIAVLAALIAVMFAAPAYSQQSAPGPKTLFTNVNVFDGVNEKRIMNANVLVEGNLIKQVSTAKIDAPGATVIDGGGRTLMPGLIDVHWHVLFNSIPQAALLQSDFAHMVIMGTKSAEASLMRGFTSVRDVGGNRSRSRRQSMQGSIQAPESTPRVR
jgi:imidazolonepropionase-like amidohydrolase